MLGAVLVDVTPLRTSRRFRWLYLGQIGAQVSRQVLVVAVPYQVFVLTGSSLIVGLVGLVQILPVLVFAIVGGTVVDAFDRRKVLVAVELALGLTAVGFGLNAGPAASLWPIFVLIAANAGLVGVEAPARSAVIPSLVTPAQLPSAFALNQTLSQAAQVIGPAIAGLLIARLDIAVAYWVSAGAAALTALMLVPLGPLRPADATGRISFGAIAEGWRYLRSVPVLQHVMLVDLNAMVFGMPRALFPAIGTAVLGGDAATVGLLHAAPGAGALLGALTAGWVSAVRRQGRVVILAVSLWGLSVAAFGVVRNLPLALVLLGIAGAADVVSNIFGNTILQTAVPEGLRGRITSFKMALTTAGPRLGDAEAGAVAALAGPVFSVVSGGLASIAGTVLIGWRGRALWDQHTERPAELPAQVLPGAAPDP